jgi:uncharacterized membrane-anchored protein
LEPLTRDAEALIATGEVVMLELAPVDPRSLMQGDYMRLAYAIERQTIATDDPAPTLILTVDGRGVATFARLAKDGAAGPGERAFAAKRQSWGDHITVEPHSFLFQEGRADEFAKARYGIFRVAPTGRHLLVGLADRDGRRIE